MKKAPAKPAKAPPKAAATVKSKPAAAAKATAAKAKPKAAPKPAKANGGDPATRQHYVQVAAYYIAERRGFLDGCEMSDWCQAETEIERMLNEGKLSL